MSGTDGRDNAPRAPLADVEPALIADGRWAPWPVPIVVATTLSTMAEVGDLAESGAAEGSVVVAEEQTAGRGRVGRAWQSPRSAGLWLSILLRPACPPAELGWLPLVTGVAIVQALRSLTEIPLRLKWPNDIVFDEGAGLSKVGGILAERLSDGVVVGIGINVNQDREELPPGGTSLRLLGSNASREHVLVAVLGSFAQAYREWCAGREAADAYARLCVTLGSAVRVEGAGGTLEGLATGLGPHGELLVTDVSGVTHAISAGDVLLVRPAIG